MLNAASAASSSVGSVVMSWPWRPGLQEIERRSRNVGGREQLGVVGIDDGVDAHCGERAVLVLVGGVDHVSEPSGLNRSERARLLPVRAKSWMVWKIARSVSIFRAASCCSILLVEPVAQARR